VAKQFAMASATMLIPATLLGASLPLACAIHARLTSHVASSTGSVFAANTLGGILGTMITGIVLVPTFGFDTSLAAAASVSVAAGCLAWGCTLLVRRDERTRLLPWLGLIGALGMWIWAVRAAPPLPLGIDGIGERIFVAEDASGRVEVHERAGGFRTLVSDGTHRWGSTDPPMLQGMHRQGYLPLLLHPEPRRIVEIGLATGINLAPALAYDAVRSVTVVEVSPAIVRAAELFAEHNGGLVGHPKVDLVVDDGFSYLHHTEQRFDVIIIGLLTPYRSGAGNLFSVEMYRACARRLDAQGILVHWLPLNQLTPEGLRAIVRTFQEVFPNLHLWERGHYVALVGLEEGVELDYAAVASAMRDPSIAEDLRTWKLDDPLAFFSAYLMGPDEARTFAEGAPLSSRDHPVTEFSRIRLDWALSYRYAQENLEALLPHRTSPTRSMGSAQPDLHAALERVSEARSWSLQGALLQSQGHHRLAIDRFVRAIELNPTEEIATQELTKYEAALRSKKMGTPTSR
jgi:spermidine synthase